jgi:hypothetical protein
MPRLSCCSISHPNEEALHELIRFILTGDMSIVFRVPAFGFMDGVTHSHPDIRDEIITIELYLPPWGFLGLGVRAASAMEVRILVAIGSSLRSSCECTPCPRRRLVYCE